MAPYAPFGSKELMTSKNIAESEQMLATECRHQAIQAQLLVSAVVSTLEISDRELQARLMARNDCLLVQHINQLQPVVALVEMDQRLAETEAPIEN